MTASHLNTPQSVLDAPKPRVVILPPDAVSQPSLRRLRVLERRAAKKEARR